MVKDFTFSKVAPIRDKYAKLLSNLQELSNCKEIYQEQIEQSCKDYVSKKAEELLASLPLLELRDHARGVPVKILEDAGYRTVTQVAKLKERDLLRISGIGEYRKDIILAALDEIQRHTLSSVKIKLNIDEKTAEQTQIIRSVYGWMNSDNLVKQAKDLQQDERHQVIADALQAAKRAKSRLRWIFTSSKKKKNTASIIQDLEEEMDKSTYPGSVKEIYHKLEAIRNLEDSEIWKDFSAHPIDYYNALEQVVPKYYEDANIYGLAENELDNAQEIDQDLTEDDFDKGQEESVEAEDNTSSESTNPNYIYQTKLNWRDLVNGTKPKEHNKSRENSSQAELALQEVKLPAVKVPGISRKLIAEVEAQPLNLKGFKGQLRKYQVWGTKYALRQKRLLLGDEMGLGKTIQTIAAMVSLANEGASHFLVVCPTSVLVNWCREVDKFSELRCWRLHGNERTYQISCWIRFGGVGVTTYGVLNHTLRQVQANTDFRYALLAVDEAHYVKNPLAQRTIEVKKASLYTDRILFMTGTALENHPQEMQNLLEIVSPTLMKEIIGTVSNLNAAARFPNPLKFRQQVAPAYLRRTREDVLVELPELIENELWCELSTEEEKEYEEIILRGNMHEARQVSWNMPNLNSSSKAKQLKQIVKEAKEEERKVVVFSYYLSTLGKVEAMLTSVCQGVITGQVQATERQRLIDSFDDSAPGSVLLSQIVAGGTGLNIQSASVVVICEPQLKPTVESQAISRVYRMGQTRNVQVYRLLCQNTIDELIIERLAEKQRMFDAYAHKSSASDYIMDYEIDTASAQKLFENEQERIRKKLQGKAA